MLGKKLDCNFDCAIILNGEITDEDISLLRDANDANIIDVNAIIKIAADGAANVLLKNDIVLNYIVGDLDSFNSNENILNSKLVIIPNQEQYDFEKCLEFAINRNLMNIIVFGMNGGQLDHTLNNWSIFVKYSVRANLFCYTHKQIGTIITRDISFNANIDDIISIIPIPIAVLTTEGLMWDLNNTKLEFGKTEGARNKAISKEIKIELHSGKYILFISNVCL
jgi:thiamine pyrophosphokinase